MIHESSQNWTGEENNWVYQDVPRIYRNKPWAMNVVSAHATSKSDSPRTVIFDAGYDHFTAEEVLRRAFGLLQFLHGTFWNITTTLSLMLTLDFFGCSGSSCRKGLKFHHPSNKQGTLLISIFELLGWVDLTKSGDFFFWGCPWRCCIRKNFCTRTWWDHRGFVAFCECTCVQSQKNSRFTPCCTSLSVWGLRWRNSNLFKVFV